MIWSHVGDVVRMVEAYQRIHGTSPSEPPTTSQLGSTTVRSQSPSVSSRIQKSLINSSGTRATASPTPTAIVIEQHQRQREFIDNARSDASLLNSILKIKSMNR